MQTDIAQIFFPTDSLDKQGYLIGFNIQGLVFTIISVEESADLLELDAKLQQFHLQPQLSSVFGARLQVLGVLQRDQNLQPLLDTWVHLQAQKTISLRSLLICGYEYRVKCCMIYYDRLQGIQQLTFNIDQLANRLLTRLVVDQETMEQYYQKKLEFTNSSEDVNAYELLRYEPIVATKELHELQYSLTHINMRKVLLAHLHALFQEQCENAYQSVYLSQLRTRDEFIQMLIRGMVTITSLQRMVFLTVLRILEIKMPLYKYSFSELPLMKNTLGQLKYKLSIMSQWETLAQILTSQEQSISNSLVFRAYHQLYAGLTFMAVDTLLGVISLLFVYFNVQRLLGFIHKYGSTIHIAVLSEEVEWLMGFPAGLKTNKPLNSVMGQAILQIMLLWNHITTFVTPYEPYLVQVMLGFCLFGVTFQVALASDLINICTIHVYYIYRSLMFLYRQIRIFALMLQRVTKDRYFDTKENKILVKQFQWDQKILAMFFTFFLVMMLPTVALYYFWFLLIVLFIYIVNVFLNAVLQILNHFPLFLLIQYYRNPFYFPVGVTLDVGKVSQDETVHATIRPTKMPINYIFKSFIQKILWLRKMVDIPAVLKSAFSGQDIMAAIRQQATKRQRKRSRHFNDFVSQPRRRDQRSELRNL